MWGRLIAIYVFSVGATAASVFPAKALPLLPDFQVSGNVVANANPGSSESTTSSVGTTSASGTGVDGAAQTRTVVAPSSAPSVQASGSAEVTNSSTGAAFTGDGILTYYLELVGAGSGPVSVTANAIGSISSSAIASGNISAQLTTSLVISNGIQTLFQDEATVASDGLSGSQAVSYDNHGTGQVTGTVATGFSGGFTESGTYSFLANTVYTVTIEALVSGYVTGGSEQFAASVDPQFIVNDPLYSLDLSPNVGNGIATTPVPASLPLFATGLGELGLLGWRRKRKAKVAV